MPPLKKVNTGGLPFREMRSGDKFYVDKSMLIADILESDDRGVYLFTRSRRFGKSTNISMLDAFFNIEYSGNDWFDGLEISEHHEYDGYRNAFPVIYLDLKDVVPTGGDSGFGLFIEMFTETIRETAMRFDYLLESERVNEADRKDLRALLDRNVGEARMSMSVRALCRMLEDHHGRKPVVLIDEYDRAVTDTFDTDLQTPVINFLSGFMSSTLNPSLQMAYVTGVMQVAKSGMFSGVNNLNVNNVFSSDSDERFGFTEDEVRRTLEYYGRSDMMDEARAWYDGYRFGDAEVYNPFSVMTLSRRGSRWATIGRTPATTGRSDG